uniref:Uncharacterized protein n=1 Tax=Aegilops tauschii subsp. strangulata TaxID=200361 RepID=A0A453SQ43_AEGTS
MVSILSFEPLYYIYVSRTLLKKGFSPLCIPKQLTPIQGTLGRTAHQAKKEGKKLMPTMAARQSADDPPPLRPPKTNHHSPRL